MIAYPCKIGLFFGGWGCAGWQWPSDFECFAGGCGDFESGVIAADRAFAVGMEVQAFGAGAGMLHGDGYRKRSFCTG